MGASPFYFPNYNSGFHLRCFRICCVVLQGCLRFHCGISKSQMNEMVNLIPTCIVTNKNYSTMIPLYSERQCIEGGRGGGRKEKEDGRRRGRRMVRGAGGGW